MFDKINEIEHSSLVFNIIQYIICLIRVGTEQKCCILFSIFL